MTPADLVLDAVARQLDAAPSARRFLIAFSGGPDSTALAWTMSRLRSSRALDVVLVHFDHGLDSGSASRAEMAEQLAAQLDLEIVVERATQQVPPGHSIEAWAREQRYRCLNRLADRLAADFIATAHHADDQAETLLLRLAFGSGLQGLAGIRAREGRLIRPLLGLRRHHLLAALEQAGLVAIDDPTNRDLERPRNDIRHRLLPEWTKEQPELVEILGRLARSSSRATRRLDAFFTSRLEIEPLPAPPAGGAQLDRLALEALPESLWSYAFSSLERTGGRALPTPTSARNELTRQLRAGGRVGCDASESWRWQADGRRLRLLPPQKPMPQFTYTVEVPGRVFVAETGTLLSIIDAPEGSVIADRADRALVRQPPGSCQFVEIRNRRSGDRLWPEGRQSEKRLKELLIDQRVPRDQRDHLPLLVIDGHVAWVPGIALDERFRACPGEPAWLVELHPATGSPAPSDPNDERGSTP